MVMSSPSAKVLVPPGEWEDLVSRLLESYQRGPRAMHHLGGYELPQSAEVVTCLGEIRALLYPGFVGQALTGASEGELRAHVRAGIEAVGARLRRQVYRGLHHRCQLIKGSRDLDCAHCAEAADRIVRQFL